MSSKIQARRVLLLLLGLIGLSLYAQSPDALVRVLVTDPAGKPLTGAEVTARLDDRGFETKQKAGEDGVCFFGALSPGVYSITVSQPGYVSRREQGIRFEVGSRQEMTVVLFPETNRSRTAPDQVADLVSALPPPVLAADTVASSVSVVLDESKILQLPLQNRNVYSLFLLEPGVTSQGASVRRGLSFSVHGQRVSGSNYLLDGVDNNNIRLTGPVTVTSVEGIQEIRMVKSSFSADNGRATSFVAPLLTRPGVNALHGTAFGYLGNDAFDANTSSNNANGLQKPSLKHLQAGFSLSGPIIRNRTFFSSVLELSRLRFGENQTQILPTAAFIAALPANSPFRPMFETTPPIPVTPSPTDPFSGSITLEVPNKLDRLLGMARVDHVLGRGRDRLMARYTTAAADVRVSNQISQEYRGYDALWATDSYRGQNSMIGWVRTFESGPVNELRAGWSRDRTDLPRPYGDRPIMLTPVLRLGLPSSNRLADERANNNVVQISDIFQLRRGRSSISFGGDLRRNISNGISPGLDSDAFGGTGFLTPGFFPFSNLNAVMRNAPSGFGAAVDRFSTPFQFGNLNRNYRATDYALWVHDDIKVSRRLSLNVGLRWEFFGVLHNTDRAKDVNFYTGAGATPEERLKNGALRRTTDNPGDLEGRLHRSDAFNLAPSASVAWDPLGKGTTVLRAGYAMAFDRIYDTARDVRTNSIKQIFCPPTLCSTMLLPVERMFPLVPPSPSAGATVAIDANLGTPYAQNWYAGMQQSLTKSLLIEIGHSGSVGRKLVSRDVVNRVESGGSAAGTIDDDFISNQGSSNYAAFELALRQRPVRGLQYQLSYTWSHAIDNQSDLLEGVRFGPDRLDVTLATFTRALDPGIDRGSANFDQRHNLVLNWVWDIPGPRSSQWKQVFAGWSVSGIGAHRSGFPVTAIGSRTATDPRFQAPGLRFNRLDLIGDAEARPRIDISGGKRWLYREDFQVVNNRLGTLGRNSLTGPGSWNYDLAVMRSFAIRESRARVQFRAEFYNVFNHANLLPPVSDFSAADFGVAYAGRSRTFSRFGELPLDSASRRIQFAVRIRF